MYLIELIVKWINPNKKYEPKKSYDPFLNEELEDEECEHIFLPVDSTGDVLACTKCGQMIKRTEK